MKRYTALVLALAMATGCAPAASSAGSVISSSYALSPSETSPETSSEPYSSSEASSETSSEAFVSSFAASSSKASSAASSRVSSAASASSAVSSAASSVSTDDFTPDPDWDWALILVNKNSLLSESYTPQISQYNSSRKFETRAVSYLSDMVSAAKADGIKLSVISSYRTFARQEELYSAKVNQYLKAGYSQADAESAAAAVVAPPGTSEHCTGLAVDIISNDWYDTHSELTAAFDKTDEYKWLASNAAKYGFILRYPKGKESVTMIDYEPWHYRFVGVENAKYITANGLTLEEFDAQFGKGK